MRKVALYLRTSTELQANGLDSQHKALTAYCELKQLLNHEIYSDFGVSGAKSSRPELDKLMHDCELGLIDTVIVYSFSRFARSTKHLILALEFFENKNIKFISITENIDTSTPLGKTIYQIIAAISELERSLIKERVVNGMKAARLRGKRIGATKKYTNSETFVQLSKAGKTVREIASIIKCSTNTVVKILKQHQQATLTHTK